MRPKKRKKKTAGRRARPANEFRLTAVRALTAAVLPVLLTAVSCTSLRGEEASRAVHKEGLENASGRQEIVTVFGQIEPAGITSWMYGTHVLRGNDGKLLYALRGEDVELGRYEGRRVRLRGYLAEGYPVDGGPPYLWVREVEPADENTTSP
jgi:hypothetical protein